MRPSSSPRLTSRHSETLTDGAHKPCTRDTANIARALLVMLDHPDICLPCADAAARNPPGVTSIARLMSALGTKHGAAAGMGGLDLVGAGLVLQPGGTV